MVMSIEEDRLFVEVLVYGYTDTIYDSRQALQRVRQPTVLDSFDAVTFPDWSRSAVTLRLRLRATA